MVTSPGRTLAYGTAWMIGFRLLDRSIGFISTLILARLLTPNDFGLVAMATSLIAFIELFGSFGVDMALIQRPAANRDHYDSAWTLNVLIGVGVAALLLLGAQPLASFYTEPRLEPLVAFLAIGPLLQGAENIGVVAFRRELSFDREFRFLLAKRLCSFLVVVPLALWLRNYWALAIGMVMGRALGTGLSYALHPFRPRLSLRKARELLHFSFWLVGQNLVVFCKERAPDFIVGKFAGAAALGTWSIANELSSLVGTELIAPMNRAAFPTYSRLVQNPAALANEYLSVAAFVTLLVTPLVIGLAAVAPLVVAVLLGPQWQAAGLLVTLLAFQGLTNVFLGTTHAAVLAVGKPAVFAKIYFFQACLLLPLSFWLTRRYGLQGTAIAAVGTAMLLLPVNVTLVMRTLGVSAGQLLVRVWRPLLSAAVMYGVTLWAQPELDVTTLTESHAVWLLFVYVALGAIVYVAVVLALWTLSGRPTGAESVFLEQLAARWRRVIARTTRVL
jgi:O-antigen/teichoic acid export membrane protein